MRRLGSLPSWDISYGGRSSKRALPMRSNLRRCQAFRFSILRAAIFALVL